MVSKFVFLTSKTIKMQFWTKNCSVKVLVSIVIPCFNEEAVLPETFQRLTLVRSKIKSSLSGIKTTSSIACPEGEKTASRIKSVDEGLNFELVFINDGSRDKTLDILRKFKEEDSEVRIINFARNFGHQLAVTAGMDASNGDVVVLIDSDLQDPPELIEKMIKLWLEGNDVVYATRTKRKGESFFKLVTAGAFYRVLNLLSDTSIPLDTGDFRLMDRAVVDVLCQMPEHDRFIRGMVSWVGFKQVSLRYKRDERHAGESKYPLKKMLAFALSGILSFSIKPLRIASWVGFACSLIAFLFGLYVNVLCPKFFI